MPFSWKQAKEDAIKIKIRRAMTNARHPVYKDGTINTQIINHKAWVTAAAKKDYTQLVIEVTDMVKKRQEQEMESRRKLAPK